MGRCGLPCIREGRLGDPSPTRQLQNGDPCGWSSDGPFWAAGLWREGKTTKHTAAEAEAPSRWFAREKSWQK